MGVGGRVCWMLAVCLFAGAVGLNFGQAQAEALNRNIVVLDPAHGGADSGGRIDGSQDEKGVTLALAGRLRQLLAARGFTVISTRDSDTNAAMDARAETANRSRAGACVVIHASSGGTGVALASSALGSALMRPLEYGAGSRSAITAVSPVAWDRAQETYVAQSLGLENEVGAALLRTGVPVVMARVAMRPLDNLMCPAISVEIGRLTPADVQATPASDDRYQQRVAEAIVATLVRWRGYAGQPEYLPDSGLRADGGRGNAGNPR